MRLEDFNKDIDSLLNFYKDNINEAKTFLKYWIEARQYTEQEFQLLFFLVETRQQDVLLQNYVLAGEKNDSGLLFNLESEALFDLKRDLTEWTVIEDFQFQEIDETYLVSSIKKAQLVKAEKWLMSAGFINKNGFWLKTNIGLAAFIQFLINEYIIDGNVDRKKIETYFSMRYNDGELIGDSFKLNKIQKSGKLELFSQLSEFLKIP